MGFVRSTKGWVPRLNNFEFDGKARASAGWVSQLRTLAKLQSHGSCQRSPCPSPSEECALRLPSREPGDFWKGEVFVYVGRNQNLKDLKAVARRDEPVAAPWVSCKNGIENGPFHLTTRWVSMFYPLGRLGFERAQHRQTPRPSVDGTRSKTQCPFVSQPGSRGLALQ